MKIACIVLSVMFVMALLCVCLGFGNAYDFFGGFGDFLEPFEAVSNFGTVLVKDVFGAGTYDLEDDVHVRRFYFRVDDDTVYYADFVYSNGVASIKNMNDYVHYSTYNGAHRFYRGMLLDKNMQSIVTVYGDMVVYKLNVKYSDYLLNYQKNPSTDGWKKAIFQG